MASRDHPRMGGEKWAGVEDFMSYIGSPPRGRGKDGVVPADITSRLGSPPPGGEKFGHPKYTTNEGGSPPRGRGKGQLPFRNIGRIGITPAWAGKSYSPVSG